MLLSLIFFVIITSFVGFNIIMLFDRKGVFNWPEKLGLSYLFGIGAITLEMFIMGLFGFEFVTTCILTPWIILFLLNVLRYHRLGRINTIFKESSGPPASKFDIFEKILLFLLSFQVVYAFFKALIKPIESYDSVSIWALKAKILYLAKTIPADFFHMISVTFHGIHADYPLLLPFSEAWFYTFFGNFNDHLVKIIFPLNLLAFLLVFYSVLKRITGKRKIALLFTFILASIKQFSDYATIGSADLQMAIYCFLTFIFLFMWVKYKRTPYLAASTLSCVFTFWAKAEGAVVFLITLTLLTSLFFVRDLRERLTPKNFRYLVGAMLVLFILFASWLGFKASLGLENDIININTFKNLRVTGVCKRIIAIGYEYQKHIFGFKKWNIVWIAFLYFVIVRFKSLLRDYRYIIIPVGGILLAYTAIYMITPQDISWHLSRTASRLLIHILPLVVFFIALNINHIRNRQYPEGA